jgi:hypothetical protein
MVGVAGELNLIITSLNSCLMEVGINPPTLLYIFINSLLILLIILYTMKKIFITASEVAELVKSQFYDIKTINFINIRPNFIAGLESEVVKLNRSSKWSDSLPYVELEAKVEVDSYTGIDSSSPNNSIVLLRDLVSDLINNSGTDFLAKPNFLHQNRFL